MPFIIQRPIDSSRAIMMDRTAKDCGGHKRVRGRSTSLRDDGDNHILELAVAGGALANVTNNVADFRSTDLCFPDLQVLAPRDALRELL